MSIVRGNDELGFFLRELGPEQRDLAHICFRLSRRECSLCRSLGSGTGNPFKSFKRILQHIPLHNQPSTIPWYDREIDAVVEIDNPDKAHYNLLVGILQQLIIYETRKRKGSPKAIAIYKLNSQYDLSLNVIGYIIDQPNSVVARLASKGMMIEREGDMPKWVTNVLAASQTTGDLRYNPRDGPC